MSVAAGLGLQLVFALFVAGAGYVAAQGLERRLGLTPLAWIERLCVGAVVVVGLLALLGWSVAVAPRGARPALAIAGLGAFFLASLWAFARGAWRDALRAGASAQIYAFAYLVLCALSLVLALLPVRLPVPLVDGPYVNKQDVLGVRVQYIAGHLPGDNAIPHVVSEYLLRDISFKKERPIVPGQEVTNRPILAALVLVPFRAAFNMPAAWTGPFPRFTYVSTSWPDYTVLMRDEAAYGVSQSLGISLNALLMLAAGALALRVGASSPALSLAIVALAMSSPYVLFQTYFTWPKFLAGFFVMVAWLATARLGSAAIAGLALGLAYLSHPYAIAYLAGYGLLHAWSALKQLNGGAAGVVQRMRQPVQQGLNVMLVFVLVVVPWFVWSKWMLDIPSDLIAQNLIQPGQRWRDFFWVRPFNALSTLLPMHLLAYPIDLMQLVRSSAVNLAGSVGLVAAMAAVHRVCATPVLCRAETVLLWVLPASLLVFVFSTPAIPTVHGLQPLVFVLIVAGAAHLWHRAGHGWALLAVGLQVLLNVMLLARYVRGLF